MVNLGADKSMLYSIKFGEFLRSIKYQLYVSEEW